MLVSDVMSRAWVAAGDAGQIKISNYQMLNAYNDANRIMRKLILDQFPNMIEQKDNKTTTAGTSFITLDKKALRLTDVRIEGRKIGAIDSKQITDLTATGKPINYYMDSLETLSLYPIPNGEYPVFAAYIPAYTDAIETDESGYPTEIETLMMNYMVAMLTGGQADTSAWADELGRILGNIDGDVLMMGGYY